MSLNNTPRESDEMIERKFELAQELSKIILQTVQSELANLNPNFNMDIDTLSAFAIGHIAIVQTNVTYLYNFIKWYLEQSNTENSKEFRKLFNKMKKQTTEIIDHTFDTYTAIYKEYLKVKHLKNTEGNPNV